MATNNKKQNKRSNLLVICDFTLVSYITYLMYVMLDNYYFDGSVNTLKVLTTTFLFTFLIVISIAFSDVENLFQILSHSLIVFLILYISKIPLKIYLKRLTIDIPFIIFALFLPFLSSENNDIVYTLFGIDIYRTGLEDMFGILFKATLGVTMGIVLTAVTTTIELIYGLQKLKLPQIIIAIMSFAIRYIDVFIDEFKRVRISMRSSFASFCDTAISPYVVAIYSS